MGQAFSAVLLVSPLVAFSAPAHAQVAVAQAAYGGSATGTALHTNALQVNATTTIADAEEAQSGAIANSQGVATLTNEYGVPVVAPRANKNSAAQGVGLAANVMTSPVNGCPQTTVQLAGCAAADAAPSMPTVATQIGPVALAPVAHASLVDGRATANWQPNACVLGAPLAEGYGDAANAGLVDAGAGDVVATATAPLGQNAVTYSDSLTKLAAQTGSNGQVVGSALGVLSRTRQVYAPVNVNLPALSTSLPLVNVTLLGVWQLQAVATGVPGNAYYTWGPVGAANSDPVANITIGTTTTVVTLQQLVGGAGVSIPLPGGVGQVDIGLPPHRIGGTGAPVVAADGTSVSAAMDVVHISLAIPGALNVLDLRIGHMEVAAHVPAGGVTCDQLPVTKTATPNPVSAGSSFTYDIAVTNPYDCAITVTNAVDTIEAKSTIHYAVTGTTPAGGTTAAGGAGAHGLPTQVVTFPTFTIAPRSTSQLHIAISVAADSAAGQMYDAFNIASAGSSCVVGSAQSDSAVVGLAAHVAVATPAVTTNAVLAGPAPAAELPRTGDNNLRTLAVGALALAMGLALSTLASQARKPTLQ